MPRGEWVELIGENGGTYFEFTKNGYVKVQLPNTYSDPNFGISESVIVGFDGMKFVKYVEPSQLFWTKSWVNGHYYRMIPDCGNWTSCEEAAVKMGGHLATIRSSLENTWLISTFGNKTFWIGMTDKDQEGVWRWISGEPVLYTNWNPSSNEPNDYYPCGGEDYGTIMGDYNNLWNDLGNDCSGSPNLVPAIVEYAN